MLKQVVWQAQHPITPVAGYVAGTGLYDQHKVIQNYHKWRADPNWFWSNKTTFP